MYIYIYTYTRDVIKSSRMQSLKYFDHLTRQDFNRGDHYAHCDVRLILLFADG